MATHTEHDEGPSAAGVGYEPTDVHTRPVVVASFFLFLLMLFGFLGAWFFWTSFEDLETANRPAVSPVYERHVPDGPLLQAEPAIEWAEYKKTQLDFLDSYGWVDEAQGKAHVPIDVAVRAVLEKGALPSWKAEEGSP